VAKRCSYPNSQVCAVSIGKNSAGQSTVTPDITLARSAIPTMKLRSKTGSLSHAEATPGRAWAADERISTLIATPTKNSTHQNYRGKTLSHCSRGEAPHRGGLADALIADLGARVVVLALIGGLASVARHLLVRIGRRHLPLCLALGDRRHRPRSRIGAG